MIIHGNFPYCFHFSCIVPRVSMHSMHDAYFGLKTRRCQDVCEWPYFWWLLKLILALPTMWTLRGIWVNICQNQTLLAVLRKTVYNVVLPFRTNRYLPLAASKQYSSWEFLLVGEQRKAYIRQQGYIAFSKPSIVQANSMTHSY